MSAQSRWSGENAERQTKECWESFSLARFIFRERTRFPLSTAPKDFEIVEFLAVFTFGERFFRCFLRLSVDVPENFHVFRLGRFSRAAGAGDEASVAKLQASQRLKVNFSPKTLENYQQTKLLSQIAQKSLLCDQNRVESQLILRLLSTLAKLSRSSSLTLRSSR